MIKVLIESAALKRGSKDAIRGNKIKSSYVVNTHINLRLARDEKNVYALLTVLLSFT